MSYIDTMIATPTPLADLPYETQKSLVSLTFSAFCEWREFYDKYGPESSSRQLAVALGKYEGAEKLMQCLIGPKVLHDVLLVAYESIPAGPYDGLHWLRTVEKLRRLWAGEVQS